MADPITSIPQTSLDYAAKNPNATVAQQVSAGVVPGSTSVTSPTAPPVTPTTTPTATTTPTPTQPQTGTGTTTQTPQASTQGPAPTFNGSVVDLLNSAGVDSSYANRAKLAQQFGIQGYTGTAAQNTDLAKKYLDFYKSKQGTAAPDQNPRVQIQQGATATQPAVDPTKQFMDQFASMNPIESQIFNQLSTLTSTNTQRQSLVDLAKGLEGETGITADKLQLADINKIMRGTEDDIRSEITAAGGFATESQIAGIVAARNKVLLNQAQYLQDTINAKNDYVERIVSLTQADREEVDRQVSQKLGISQALFSIAETMQNNAKDNYKAIINSVGWGGLAAALKDSPEQMASVSKMFGLQPGELESLAAYKKPLTAMEQAQLEGQQLSNQTEKLQQQKLRQDLSTPKKADTELQNFGTATAPHYKLVNSQTGQVIADYGSDVPVGDKTQQLAGQQQNITDTQGLIDDPSLNAAVGPNMLARDDLGVGYYSWTGGKSNFIAGVQQLTQQLTLNSLQNAKQNGATFGALSEGELKLLEQSATKLNSWAIKDKAGNVTGYNANETDFKAELDKINNFQKLDFILKGGDPASVGVQEQTDGTYWTRNSDGSYTQIQ